MSRFSTHVIRPRALLPAIKAIPASPRCQFFRSDVSPKTDKSLKRLSRNLTRRDIPFTNPRRTSDLTAQNAGTTRQNRYNLRTLHQPTRQLHRRYRPLPKSELQATSPPLRPEQTTQQRLQEYYCVSQSLRRIPVYTPQFHRLCSKQPRHPTSRRPYGTQTSRKRLLDLPSRPVVQLTPGDALWPVWTYDLRAVSDAYRSHSATMRPEKGCAVRTGWNGLVERSWCVLGR